MFHQFYELTSDRNLWIVVVFLIYVIFVFFFGVVYYKIYLRNHRTFSFNSDIVHAQSNTVELSSSQHLEQLTSELNQLQLLKQDISILDNKPAIDNEGRFNTSTIRGSIAHYTFISPNYPGVEPFSGPPHPGPPSATIFKVSTLDGKTLNTIVDKLNYSLPETVADFRKRADNLIDDRTFDLESAQMEIRKVLDSLKTDKPDIWTYWDFLYFSAITQFTVGYGDILPNSTPVRLIIILQTCIAAALLVVVINFAFSR